METNKLYIDKLLSLSKASAQEPFLAEWLPLYGTEPRRVYLADLYREQGQSYKEMDILQAGTRLQTILDLLLPTIAGYPYSWPLNGQKLDVYGFDFELNGSETQLEILTVAKEEVWRKLSLAFPVESLVSAYVQPETVTGGHLTKCSLVFEKASPLSFLSFRMHSVFPVRLASLLYESDISGFSEAKKVNLDMIHLQQSNETITLLFGQPIFAKRLTFVLAQDNASGNTYYLSQEAEDFSLELLPSDESLVDEWLEEKSGRTYMTNEIYSDEAIKDWSATRLTAYRAWRTEKLAYLEGN